MLKHHLIVAFRNLARQRLHSVLSILVLALGLTCFLAAALAKLHLGSYDRQFAKSERIYVIYQSATWPQVGYRLAPGRTSAAGIAEKLAIEIPELEAVARQMMLGAAVSADGRSARYHSLAGTDPAWADMFELRAVAGDARGALERQAAVVLTTGVASELFGSSDAVGRTLTLSGQKATEVTVGAVVAPVEGPSHLAQEALTGGLQIIASWDVLAKLYPTLPLTSSLFANGNTTYVVLPADGSLTPATLNARLKTFATRPLPESGAAITLEARPVSSIAADDLQKRFEGFQNGVPLPAAVGDIVMSLALLVLAVGCVNFVNLMTARSMSRAREIGVRKSVGATRYGIASQELFQTALVVLTGTGAALLLLSALRALTENQWGVLVGVPWTRPVFWALLAALLAGVTVVAGSYPAAVLARIHPVAALRLGTMKTGPRFLRTALVVVQVAAAAFLTIVVIVASAQAAMLRSAIVGRFADPVVLISWPQSLIQGGSFDALMTELARGPGIKGVAVAPTYPLQGARSGKRRLSRTPIDATAPSTYDVQLIGFDYFAVMQIPLLGGRDYSRDFADDVDPNTRDELAARKTPFHVVLDRKAARSLGWSNPGDAVGQLLYTGAGLQTEVIGVVETVADSIRDSDGDGTIYYLYSQSTPLTAIRIAAASTDAALAYVDSVWKDFAPDAPVARQFMDSVFDNTFRMFTLAGRVVEAIGAFAVAIAAIGLFGMAAYVTRRRTREIGLRKSQGASGWQIARMLLWDFTKPVLLGNAIAWPFALMAARTYVDYFSERTPITVTPFLLALLGSLLVAWLAVGGFVQARCAREPDGRAARGVRVPSRARAEPLTLD